MVVSRVFVSLIFAAFLAGCAGMDQLSPQAQEKVLPKLAQIEPDRPSQVKTEAKADTATPPPKPHVTKQKPAAVSATLRKEPPESADVPDVGSKEWVKEQANDKRKDEHLKEVIQGICRGC
jgi:PBP1b-binding outer membrane lipoprotein LpoB